MLACRSAFDFAVAYPISGLNVTIVYNGIHPWGWGEGNRALWNRRPRDASVSGCFPLSLYRRLSIFFRRRKDEVVTSCLISML